MRHIELGLHDHANREDELAAEVFELLRPAVARALERIHGPGYVCPRAAQALIEEVSKLLRGF
jgi:hypothetical protein